MTFYAIIPIIEMIYIVISDCFMSRTRPQKGARGGEDKGVWKGNGSANNEEETYFFYDAGGAGARGGSRLWQ